MPLSTKYIAIWVGTLFILKSPTVPLDGLLIEDFKNTQEFNARFYFQMIIFRTVGKLCTFRLIIVNRIVQVKKQLESHDSPFSSYFLKLQKTNDYNCLDITHRGLVPSDLIICYSQDSRRQISQEVKGMWYDHVGK